MCDSISEADAMLDGGDFVDIDYEGGGMFPENYWEELGYYGTDFYAGIAGKKSKTNSIQSKTRTTIPDNKSRNSNSITSKIRKLTNQELINLSKKLLKAKDCNKKYIFKSEDIINDSDGTLFIKQRIVLEALCRGCKTIDKYLKLK